ncbi:hypothetical protein [Mesorhizobium sp. M0203]|uniref:hypothetical protein n=1 Tax=Mesorhizobium sp. M0203 TaxID=2956912 RepID=UPI00333622DE
MTTSNETPTAPEYQNSKPGEAWNAAYALPVGDAAEAMEPAGYLFELCYSHEPDHWSGTMFSEHLPDFPDIRNVRALGVLPLPKASIEPGVVEALRNVVTAWEATKSGKTSVREIQRWLVEDMKPAIDAARRSLALLNIANDPDQVKSRVAFAARCNEVK